MKSVCGLVVACLVVSGAVRAQTPPAVNPDLLVGVQALAAVATLYHATPVCRGTPAKCAPALSLKDFQLVTSQAKTARDAITAHPENQQQIVSDFLTRLQREVSSTGYERLSLYVQAVRFVIGPFVPTATPVQRKLRPDGTPVPDDQ